jgi:hypothetical protein
MIHNGASSPPLLNHGLSFRQELQMKMKVCRMIDLLQEQLVLIAFGLGTLGKQPDFPCGLSSCPRVLMSSQE